MADAQVAVEMLGGFRVQVDGEEIPSRAWSRSQAADLVKLLALAPERRMPRDQAMEALWPGRSPERAGSALRKAAHYARRALGLPGAIVLDGKMVSLADARVRTDVAEFVELADQAVAARDPVLCRRAVAIYRGELLPHDRYQEWIAPHRERVRSLYLQALAGGEQWGRLVEEDPANEEAHRHILRRHLDTGDRAAALRQFESMRIALRDHLGVLPDDESMSLYEKALELGGRDAPTPRERARALLAWGVVHWERRDLDEARRIALEARALAVDAGLGRELADASELLGLIAYAQARWPEMMTGELERTLHKSPQLTPFLLDAHICMSEFALCEVDGPMTVDEVAATILGAAERAGSRSAAALGLLLRGEATLAREADPVPARPDLERALELHQETGSLTGSALARERLAQIDDLTAHPEDGSAGHRAALDLAWRAPTSRHLVPLVYGGMLEAVEAPLVVDQAEEDMDQLDLCPSCSMSYRLGAARARSGAGDHESAEKYLAAAAKVAEMWRTGPWHAAVAETRAIVGARAGAETRRVISLLESAAEGFAAASRPRDAARCRDALRRLDGER